MPAELFASEYIRKWGRNRRSGSLIQITNMVELELSFRRRVLAPSHDGVSRIPTNTGMKAGKPNPMELAKSSG